MRIYYRISDNSYKKQRFGDKQKCLENFLATFAPTADELMVVADRCGDAAIDMIQNALVNSRHALSPAIIHKTELGNSGSLRYALQQVVNLGENVPVYLLEDDYLHLPGSRELLLEGLSLAAYVTLYDHPDKYLPLDRGGNLFVKNGGEPTRLLRSNLSHWKVTNSTTMTFASTSTVLREDLPIWDLQTRSNHPNDFAAFLTVGQKGRELIVSIPGRSTHCEPMWVTPGVNWDTMLD